MTDSEQEGSSEEQSQQHRAQEHWAQVEPAIELIEAEDSAGARSELERVLREDSTNSYALFFLGLLHFEAEDFPRALKAYLGALELSPRYLGAMIGCGQTLRMMGRYPEALRMGQQALALEPEDADALYLVAMTHYAYDNKGDAVDYLKRFLATRPEVELVFEAQTLLEELLAQLPQAPAEDPD